MRNVNVNVKSINGIGFLYIYKCFSIRGYSPKNEDIKFAGTKIQFSFWLPLKYTPEVIKFHPMFRQFEGKGTGEHSISPSFSSTIFSCVTVTALSIALRPFSSTIEKMSIYKIAPNTGRERNTSIIEKCCFVLITGKRKNCWAFYFMTSIRNQSVCVQQKSKKGRIPLFF